MVRRLWRASVWRDWLKATVVIPRPSLTFKYLFFVILGVVVSIATAPSLDAVTSEGYTFFWGLCLAAAAALATVGSFTGRTWILEAVACTAIVCLMVVYAVSPIVLILQGDWDRLAYSVIAVGFMTLPTSRLWRLIRGGADG